MRAGASLLLRVRKWSALRAWGLRIAKRSSMLCAIVAVARKLAGILHRMWVSETDFHVGFGAKITQRLRLKPALGRAGKSTGDVAPGNDCPPLQSPFRCERLASSFDVNHLEPVDQILGCTEATVGGRHHREGPISSAHGDTA